MADSEKMPVQDPSDEFVEGSIENVIYSNEENGYAICDMATSHDEIITIVGIMPFVSAGDSVCVSGKWVHNPRYGRQFSVSGYEKRMPADIASILRYLSSRTIKGIGPKTAQRIVDAFGEDTFDVIENHPQWLTEIRGISLKIALAASEDFKQQTGMRSTMLFFREFFGAALTVRIYKKWGSASVEIAKKNPYRLCNEIEGIGFEKADLMASKLGFSGDNLDRAMSGIHYVLASNASQNGHVCLPRTKLVDSSAQLLGIAAERADEALSELLRQGDLKYRLSEGEQMIYTSHNYNAEKYVAEKLCLLDKICAAVSLPDIDRFVEMEERKNGIAYAFLQKKAITDALRYGVMILTGGPGTGKTTVVRALINIFESMDFSVALSAPTGRAAKRLSESTSKEAKTIHRLLEMGYDTAGHVTFGRNEHEHLSEDVIIIDEASMVDLLLMEALLKATKPGARVIIIGDSDQLPSVGAGNVLRDLIDSERFSTVRLNEIFRQAQESLIITNAHRINTGEMPVLDVKDNDFFFMKREGERAIANTIIELCRTRLPRAYGPVAVGGVQIACPSRKGATGTENLNLLLQEALNPPSEEKKEHPFRDVVFREGDRVMQTKNNYDLLWIRESDGKDGSGIFNGDIGVIDEINTYEKTMMIVFDDRRVAYDFSLLEDLEHAYAVTIHKSQGSEYPIVIIPLGSAPQMLLTRNLFYTAVTRAQNMVILVGNEEIARRMVENNCQSMRYTGLCDLLCQGGAQ